MLAPPYCAPAAAVGITHPRPATRSARPSQCRAGKGCGICQISPMPNQTASPSDRLEVAPRSQYSRGMPGGDLPPGRSARIAPGGVCFRRRDPPGRPVSSARTLRDPPTPRAPPSRGVIAAVGAAKYSPRPGGVPHDPSAPPGETAVPGRSGPCAALAGLARARSAAPAVARAGGRHPSGAHLCAIGAGDSPGRARRAGGAGGMRPRARATTVLVVPPTRRSRSGPRAPEGG